MIKNNNIKIMGVFTSVLLLVIIVTASFAYFGSFNVNLNNNVAVNVNSVSPGDGTFTSNATQLNLQVPAVNMSQTQSNNTLAALENTATLSVSLTSGSEEVETTCTFDIYYEYTGSNFYGVSPNTKTSGVAKEITMTVNAPSGTSNFSNETNFDYNTSNGWTTENNIRKVKLVENAIISNSGTTATIQDYTFTGKYYNLDISQEQLANKSFTGIIYVSKKECKSKDIISFSINDISYIAEKNMTWGEWINSNYAKDFPDKENITTYDSTLSSKFNSYLINPKYNTSDNVYKNIWVSYKIRYSNEEAPSVYAFINNTYYVGGCYNNGASREGIPIIQTSTITSTISLYNTEFNFNSSNNKLIMICSMPTCLTPETLIDVEEEDKKGKKRRKRKMLKDIKVGDKVICINPDTLKLDTDIVTECDSAFIKRHTCYDKWYFENGTVITTVHRHRFYNVENKTFMYMDEWNIGYHGINIDGNKVKLVKHEHIEEEITHATLFTKKYNNYFANGMLSGNRHSKEINL